jgi:Xaa-Pro aminopeptidase
MWKGQKSSTGPIWEEAMYLSNAEKERRYGLLHKQMAEENMDALLVYGNSVSVGSFGAGSFRYLTDFFLIAGDGLLLFFSGSDPVLWVGNDIHAHQALKESWIHDVRISSSYAPEVIRVIKERTKGNGRVGISSLKNLPAHIYRELQKNLASCEWIDADPILLEMRLSKSEEEHRLLKRSAEIVDRGFQTLLKSVKPGVTERELVGILEACHRGQGCDRTFNLISSGPFPRKNRNESSVLLWYPSDREIKRGDVLVLEMTAAYGGYWNQLVRAVGVGEENCDLSSFHMAILRSIGTGVSSMRPGIRTAAFVAAMSQDAEHLGYKLTAPVGHYTGLDLVDARINPGIDLILKQGAAAIVHPVLENGDAVRLFWGQTYLVLEKETVSLNSTDDKLLFIS